MKGGFSVRDLRRWAIIAALAGLSACALFFIIDPAFASYILRSLLRGSPVE